MFHENAQLISIYYSVELKKPLKFLVSERAFDFEKPENGNQSFRWKKINEIDENEITLPIDRLVLQKIKQELTANP